MFQHKNDVTDNKSKMFNLTNLTCVVTITTQNYVRSNTNEMFNTTQICVAMTQLKCQKSNTRMTSESTQVNCFTTQTCVEMGITQAIVCE